ncbi:MAG: sigma-70 family RNA polymerase sigma factor [Candidatus Andeanibacterium colombiense]|uniref:Sigma-70 family RNA polymerase sigma factor n=1 Tax=Candidatus Andeanibacterium colombiense TaxID=3121345 RepID=A0AAJ6BNC4_9SPHN|nr:MAG: sigma-70 family RNA polymerase sigma factor [Sphingomonadaceae bacterium]
MGHGRKLADGTEHPARAGAEIVPLRERLAEGLAEAAPSHPLARAFFELQQPLRAFFHRRTGAAEDTEDLLQDLWLRVEASRETFSGAEAPDNPAAYLQRIAANLALDWLRRRKVRSALADARDPAEQADDTVTEMERVLHARRAVEYLNLLIDDLPPRRREIFLLHSGLGLKPREIARRTGLSAKTVNAHVANAMVYIRKRMAAAELWP